MRLTGFELAKMSGKRSPQALLSRRIQAALIWILVLAVIARAALGIIFSTAIITTLLGWWFFAR
jgi:hypothetical protein